MNDKIVYNFPKDCNTKFCITYTKDFYNLRIPVIMEYSPKIKNDIIYKGSLKACIIQLEVYWTARIEAIKG